MRQKPISAVRLMQCVQGLMCVIFNPAWLYIQIRDPGHYSQLTDHFMRPFDGREKNTPAESQSEPLDKRGP